MKKKISIIILSVIVAVVLILGIIVSYCLINPFTYVENDKKFIMGTNMIAKQFTKHIEVPEVVIGIESSAFANCKSLESIDIPYGVKYINQYAFDGCSALKSIELPSSVTWIGAYAFYGCNALKNIKIPDSVTDIADNAFYGVSTDNAIIYVSKNSYAEQWALDNNYNIVYFEGSINADSNGNESERKTANTLTDAEVGDIVYLGNYEQDNDTSNGKEEIAWRVLERAEKSDYNTEYTELLVLSEYVLDFRGSDYLNDWLEDTFMNEAFTEEELEQYFGRYSKHVGLLRESEMDNYFTSAEDYRGVATEYVKAASGTNGSYIGWWLELGKYVGDGYNLNSKYDVRDGYSSERGVRPIVRIIIEK